MPITVGALANVPAPGDPIASPWAQQASGYLVHPFATVAALQAQWPNAPVGSVATALDTGTGYVKVAAGGAGWVTRGCDFQTAAGGAALTVPDAGDVTVFANVNIVARPWARQGLVVAQCLVSGNAGQMQMRMKQTADNALVAVAVVQAPGVGVGTIIYPYALAPNTTASWYVQWRGAGGTGSVFVDATTNKWATYAWPA